MYCPRCGSQNAAGNLRCWSCGFELQSPTAAAPPATSAPGSGIEVLIPYKNTMALTAYYLGIFSIVCGLVLGLPALVLGILGLKHAGQHPEARGKVHAWIGIILGSFTTLVSLAVIVFIALAATQH
ncbi:MAG TPA: DUF4190 domain-containing protein [Thermoanaerobaculia bacterium]|jgi:hypothetical protein|nr:DUF4190 domain-containing protein [Thermoanaerobaculia bacterium]